MNYSHHFLGKKHRIYHRGDIIKVEFGFRIGSELRNTHYAIVANKNDSPKNPNIIVIPLTSRKNGKTIRKGDVDLEDVLYSQIHAKLLHLNTEIQVLNEKCSRVEVQEENDDRNNELRQIKAKIKNTDKMIEKIQCELDHLKKGSIAMIDQITTISKMRILDPKFKDDIFDGIKLTADKLDLINEKLKERIIF